ncbi:MAG: transposase [Succinivibrio sp.]|nr:transposase [Succinivibrio sp.]
MKTLEDRAELSGRKVIKVPTMYPSFQTCSQCGYENPLVKNLSVKEWKCPCCHTRHGRDLNASVNILNKDLLAA